MTELGHPLMARDRISRRTLLGAGGMLVAGAGLGRADVVPGTPIPGTPISGAPVPGTPVPGTPVSGTPVSRSIPVGAARAVRLRQDGTLLVNGAPFFPFGYYYLPPPAPTPVQVRAHIDTIRILARAGYNAMHVSFDPGFFADYARVCDEATRRGIYFFCTVHSAQYDPTGPEMAALIAVLRTKPAILAWSIADDAGLHNPPNLVAPVNAAVKAADPGGLTYISATGSANAAAYAATADLIGCQSFFVHNDRKNWANPLSYVLPEFMRAEATAPPPAHNVIANLQAFSWRGVEGPGTNPQARWPTVTEVRNMTYQALLGDVKGILYYTYHDSQTDIHQRPEILRATGRLAREVTRLRAAFLNGSPLRIAADRPWIRAGGWAYNGRAYVVVLNTAPATALPVSLALPAGVAGPAVPLFPGQPHGLAVQGGRLRGVVAAGDVHVYSLPPH